MDEDVPTDQVLDYRHLFEAFPVALLIMRADPPIYTIVTANDHYLRATMKTREEIVGRGVFEVFPENPDAHEGGGDNLRSALDRVTRERVAVDVGVQRYDVLKPDGSGYEIRYWEPRNIPLPGADGKTLLILHRVEDVTELMRLRHVAERGRGGRPR